MKFKVKECEAKIQLVQAMKVKGRKGRYTDDLTAFDFKWELLVHFVQYDVNINLLKLQKLT